MAVLGCIFDISRLVSPSSVCETAIDVCDSLGDLRGGGHQGHLEHILL